MSELHDTARWLVEHFDAHQCDQWKDIIADLLAENERLAAPPDYVKVVTRLTYRAEAAEARLAALCEAEPVAVVDREAVGRVFWLSIIPDGTLLIPRPSMEGGE